MGKTTDTTRGVGLKTVGQLMRREVITLRPDASVAAAIQAMLKHHVRRLPVVEGQTVVGIITSRDLLGQALYRLVGDIMTTDLATIGPEQPATAALRVMDERKVGALPVVEDGRLVGIVTRLDIYKELGKLTDALTDLPWPFTLRNRAEELLRQGAEVVIIFVDLNGFRRVNKRFGHVAGDRLIIAAAQALQRLTDADRDLLCRYGGDEFALITTRNALEAEDLAGAMLEAIRDIQLPGAEDRPLSAGIGIAGGRRAVERPDVHPAATVDDLIALASRASSEAKHLERPILHGQQLEAMEILEHAIPEEEARLNLLSTSMTVAAERASAEVELAHEDHRFTGRAEGSAIGLGALRVLARAAVEALGHLLPPGWAVEMEEMAFTPFPHGEAVSVALTLAGPAGEEVLLGTAPYERNRPDAVVRATLKAVNRRLARLLRTRA